MQDLYNIILNVRKVIVIVVGSYFSPQEILKNDGKEKLVLLNSQSFLNALTPSPDK